jgi:hypothetical protein
MSVSLLLKTLASTSEIDVEAMNEVTKVVERGRSTWPSDTLDILKTKNPGLLEALQRTESQVDSLVAITNKPLQIKREFKKTLMEYEKVGSMCGAYAKRHSLKR